MHCRHCKNPVDNVFLDLGFAPPSNAYLTEEDLTRPETWYPLRVRVCEHCWLVQTEDYAEAEELFSSEYAYFSSTSTSWLAHAKAYSTAIIDELGLNAESRVIEVASNDGYLLKNFVDAGIPCIGIEPTGSTADAAERLGIPVVREFFGEELGQMLAGQGKQADLIAGNNVYAHVPDINDFTLGLKAALKPQGTITLEFPHLMELIKHNQFDTVYHEHFSYLSLTAVRSIFAKCGLRIYKVEKLKTHGGSLRIYACHADNSREDHVSVASALQEEFDAGLQKLQTYLDFQPQAEKAKNDFLKFLVDQKVSGKKVCAYGAAAKGNTLLNFAGIKADLIGYVCDAAEAKQGKYLPGSHIPIVQPEAADFADVDYVVIFPWNIADEVRAQRIFSDNQSVKFVTAIPKLQIS